MIFDHFVCFKQRFYITLIERANMHCNSFECTRLFSTVLTSAEGQKLECFKSTAKNICKSYVKNLVTPLCSEGEVRRVLELTKALSMSILQSLSFKTLYHSLTVAHLGS
jgi:hypothetical protein